MRLSDRDLAYLIDMASCCRDIVAFTSKVTFEDFQSDRMRRLATEPLLETLGEAANHVSVATRANFPSIEWVRIVGLRNKLAHDYGEVLAARVWRIATENVPALYNTLRAIPEVANAVLSGEEFPHGD